MPPQAQEYVDIALSNSERLVRLINDILDVEKIRSGKAELRLQPADLVSIVRKALAANEALASVHNVTLSLTGEIPDVEVLIDEDRLIQVLTNLISNAAKFSPAGESVELSMVKKNNRIRVNVRDSGPGISEGFAQRIFQPFAQEDSSSTRIKGGTGLGLNIAKTFIEAMHGKISFETAPGQGTTFFFDLPALLPAQKMANVSRGDTEKRMLVCEDALDLAHSIETHIRVLHVEDDGDLRQIVKRLLPEDWDIVQAATAARAKALLGERSFDLVLLDLSLPDGNGETLLDLAGSAEVVIFSASDARPALAQRVTDALVKSRTTEFQLRDLVVALMAGREPQTSS